MLLCHRAGKKNPINNKRAGGRRKILLSLVTQDISDEMESVTNA